MSRTAIESHLASVAQPTRETLIALCEIIQTSDDRIRGEIKWNAPSFAIDDHFATTGVMRNGSVRLVLHTGARRSGSKRPVTIDDLERLLTWKDDDRAIVLFTDADDVRRHDKALRAILAAWIDQTQGVVG